MKRVDMKLNLNIDQIELEPFGLTSGIDKTRPVLLLREKGGEAVLPVWLSPVDAGIALSQHNTQTFAISPHDITLQALGVLGVVPESCHFTELRGHQQYVELRFQGSRKLKALKARADHAVSFCLQAKMKFYCSRDYLNKCRQVESELSNTQTALGRGGRNESRRHRTAYLN
jgi:hypothetical protein